MGKTPMKPVKNREAGTPYSISRCTIFCCGSSDQPVLRIIWRLVRNVVTIIVAIRIAATILTVVLFAPSRASSDDLDRKLAAIGAPNSLACEALSNWFDVHPYSVRSFSGMVGL